MFPIATTRRAGMTLVELLVVVAILGLLAVAVLPVLSNTADARRTREATRIITSYIAKAQSRAIGRQEWAGFLLIAPNSSTNFALDMHLADVPTAFRGDALTTTISGSATPGGVFVITSGSLSGTTVTGTSGDLVRFDGQPPWYAYLSPTSVGLRNGGSGTENVGQTYSNTAWPSPSKPHTFELLRQPIRAGSPLTLADGRCVDLFWSGYGPVTTFTADAPTYDGVSNNPTRFTNTSSVAILFDGTGRLRQVVRDERREPNTGPVFLLVGRSDRAGQPWAALNAKDDSVGANWQYADSFWIAIDPLSGIAKSAECKPSATSVVDSQEFIRSEIMATGR